MTSSTGDPAVRLVVAFCSLAVGGTIAAVDFVVTLPTLPPQLRNPDSFEGKRLLFEACVTAYGAAYPTARLLYRLLGAHAAAAELQGWSESHMTVLRVVAGGLLLFGGWEAIVEGFLRPALPVGLVLLVLAAADTRLGARRGRAAAAEVPRPVRTGGPTAEPRPSAAERAAVYAARGYRAFYQGNIGKAQDCYDEAVRLWPHDPAYFNFRGFIWHMKGIGSWGRSGCEDLALADYADALDLDPAFAPALNNRAWLLATTKVARCRNGARAVEEATRACELSGWANPEYLDTLSVACAEVGDFDGAARWQLKALECPQYQHESGRVARKKLALFKRRKPFRE